MRGQGLDTEIDLQMSGSPNARRSAATPTEGRSQCMGHCTGSGPNHRLAAPSKGEVPERHKTRALGRQNVIPTPLTDSSRQSPTRPTKALDLCMGPDPTDPNRSLSTVAGKASQPTPGMSSGASKQRHPRTSVCPGLTLGRLAPRA